MAADVDLIRMLVHLRETGMPLADIAQFTGADAEVTDPSRLRLELLTAHRGDQPPTSRLINVPGQYT